MTTPIWNRQELHSFGSLLAHFILQASQLAQQSTGVETRVSLSYEDLSMETCLLLLPTGVVPTNNPEKGAEHQVEDSDLAWIHLGDNLWEMVCPRRYLYNHLSTMFAPVLALAAPQPIDDFAVQ